MSGTISWMQIIDIIIIAILLLISLGINWHYRSLRNYKQKYESKLDPIYNECCSYYISWPLCYSFPIIRHSFYEEFVVINGKGENEKIPYKDIITVTISYLHAIVPGFFRFKIEYDYLSIENKERRSVSLTARNPKAIAKVLIGKQVSIKNNIKYNLTS